MENLSKFALIIIAEGFFLACVVTLFLLMISRRRLHKELKRLAAREHEIGEIRQRLQLTHEHLQKANEQLKRLQNSHQQNATQEHQDSQLLKNYQQRIANLEKFKELYFDLEDRLAKVKEEGQLLDQLQTVIDSQSEMIEDLKAKLAVVSKNYGMELDLTEELKEQIQKLEESTQDLKRKLEEAKQQRDLAKMDAQNAVRYKERVHGLETTEARLQRELAAHTRRIKELESQPSPKPVYGAVRVREMEELNNKLQQREDEARRLRQECETIAIQYEELAAKSLAIAGSRDNLDDNQKAQLNELKRTLEKNQAELARKQAECEMLEKYYLELEQNASQGEIDDLIEYALGETATPPPLQSNPPREVVANDRAENKPASPANSDTAELQKTLAEKETLLATIHKDYEEIIEQFINVAREENDLRQKHEALKLEHDKLGAELRDLKQAHQALQDQQADLEKARAEYTKLEARYLALVAKRQ